jgi:hypothetical protein
VHGYKALDKVGSSVIFGKTEEQETYLNFKEHAIDGEVQIAQVNTGNMMLFWEEFLVSRLLLQTHFAKITNFSHHKGY